MTHHNTTTAQPFKPAMSPNTNTEQIILSRRELEARAALVLANIPYPPLPVMASRGENATESIASSHDILLSAIATQMMNTQLSSNAIELLNERKRNILSNLYIDLSQVWSQTGSKRALLDCYDIIASSFRAYLALYPGSPDLRILPIDAVLQGELPHTQGLEHLNNGMSPNDKFQPAADPSNSYPNLIQAYVFRICGDQDEYTLPALRDE